MKNEKKTPSQLIFHSPSRNPGPERHSLKKISKRTGNDVPKTKKKKKNPSQLTFMAQAEIQVQVASPKEKKQKER